MEFATLGDRQLAERETLSSDETPVAVHIALHSSDHQEHIICPTTFPACPDGFLQMTLDVVQEA